MEHHRLRRYAILAAKLAVAAAILVYLVVQAQQNASFERLVEQPKRWPLLAAAVGLMAIIAVVSFVRWFLLIRALGLDFRLADAMRLGCLGYVLNLVSLGSVGGDLFKAVLIAKGQPGKRTEAVATVLLDRIVGLYALLLVAAGAVLLWDVKSRGPGIAALGNATVACAAMATLGLAVLMAPAITSPRTEARLSRIPLVGSTAARLLAAIRVYRSQPLVVFVAVLISVGLHVTLVTVVLSIAHGLPGAVPAWSDHFVLVPLSMVAGSIPITPNGLGTLELAMDTLYLVLGRAQGVVPGTGTIVAFGYRLANIVVACAAAVYYVVVSGRLPTLDAEAVSGQ
jgi:uncharacterized membrane protein YbhN (UPF0104 family)